MLIQKLKKSFLKTLTIVILTETNQENLSFILEISKILNLKKNTII